MRFEETAIADVYRVDTGAVSDQRGSFGRLWCQHEFSKAGSPMPVVQTSLSVTERHGTLRGMHFQRAPSKESKLIYCVRGRIFDVALDLRPGSSTFRCSFGAVLEPGEPFGLLIPPGCAHGFLTLTDDCAVVYHMTDYYAPSLADGVRWDDPGFEIDWPEQPRHILERDAEYPDFDIRSVAGFADYHSQIRDDPHE